MDMRRLEIFYLVAGKGGFTRAAEALSLTQPTVSAAVQLLEDELETRLLNRHGREVSLTATGQRLYQYAEKIFSLRQKACSELKAMQAGGMGELLLGGSTIPGTYLLPSLVARFRQRYPALRTQLQIAGSGLIVEALKQQRIELALVGGKISERAVEEIPCFGDELCVIVPAGHPWAARQSVVYEELVQLPLLLREPGSSSRKALEERLQACGLKIGQGGVAAEVGGNEALKQGVLAGLGVAVISRLAVAEEVKRGALAALFFAGEPLRRTFCLLHLKSHALSPAAQEFKKLLLEPAGR